MKVIRQGDVYIVLNQTKPTYASLRKDRTLALGEATGHHHTLTAGNVYGELAGKQWIVLDEETELQHQEHATVVIPIGIHEVRIQREYTPQEIRRVMD
jgi:hypothetical protein